MFSSGIARSSPKEISKTLLPPVIILDGLYNRFDALKTAPALLAALPMLASKGYDVICVWVLDPQFTAELKKQAETSRIKMKVVVVEKEHEEKLTEVIGTYNGVIVFYPACAGRDIVNYFIKNLKVKPIIYGTVDSIDPEWIFYLRKIKNIARLFVDEIAEVFFEYLAIKKQADIANFVSELQAKIDLHINVNLSVVNIVVQTSKVVFINVTNAELISDLARVVQELKLLEYVVFGFFEQVGSSVSQRDETLKITCFTINLDNYNKQDRQVVITQEAQRNLGLALTRLKDIQGYILDNVATVWSMSAFTLKITRDEGGARLSVTDISECKPVFGIKTNYFNVCSVIAHMRYDYKFTVADEAYASLGEAYDDVISSSERLWLSVNNSSAVATLTGFADKAVGFFSGFSRGQANAVEPIAPVSVP